MSLADVSWSALTPEGPNYFFKPFSGFRRDAYDKYHKVSDIFSLGSIGITTSRDGLLIGIDEPSLRSSVEMFLNARLSDEEAKRLFSIDDNETGKSPKSERLCEGRSMIPIKL